MGHVHLRVADVPATVEFYRDVLGMGVMAQLGPAAAFLSAGGYHHHVGANTWESRGRVAGAARLGDAAPRDDRRSRTRASATASRPRSRSRAGAGAPQGGVLVRDPSGTRCSCSA